MTRPLPLEIAYWSGLITVGGFAAGMLLLALITNLRGKADRPVGPLGALFAAAILGGIPVAIAICAGLLVSAGLIAMQTPPIAYLFVGLAACLAFAAALGRSSYGVDGCTKMFVTGWSAYAFVWSATSFVLLGGVGQIGSEAASLTWLQPLLVAAPYAAAYARLADKKQRTFGKFVVGLIFSSALFALMFLPVQAGLVGRWLPPSDWLRFPLAALVAALILAAVPVALTALLSTAGNRRRELRDLPGHAKRLALLLLPAGFLWAAARALTGALA